MLKFIWIVTFAIYLLNVDALTTTDNGQCSFYKQSGFELQITGPLNDEVWTLAKAHTIDECGNLCCSSQSNVACDVAIFVPDDQRCALVRCPSHNLAQGPCKPQLADDKTAWSLVKGKDSTLIYVVKRSLPKSETFNLSDEEWNALFDDNFQSVFNGGNTFTDDKSENAKSLDNFSDTGDFISSSVPPKIQSQSLMPTVNPGNVPTPIDDVGNLVNSSEPDLAINTTKAILTSDDEILSTSSLLTTTETPQNVPSNPGLPSSVQILPTTTAVKTADEIVTSTPSTKISPVNTTVKLASVPPSVPLATVASTLADLNLTAISNPTEIEDEIAPTPSSPTTTTASVATTTSPTTPLITTTTTPAIRHIAVTINGTTRIRLPRNSVVLKATAAGEPLQASGFEFEWSLVAHPEDFTGTGSGLSTDTYMLSTLTAGQYTFKVVVHDLNGYGTAVVNVTVLEPIRINTPPVAVVSPAHQELTLPTDSTLLDAGQSHDDVGITLYEWVPTTAPLASELSKGKPLKNDKILQLQNLVVGNYTFKLTVTDTDGATNSTEATVYVNKKIDNPPHANAGSNQVVHFPQNSVTLCGNDSTDDWGIVRYSWAISPDSKQQVFDMQGARSKCLELSNLEVGEYTYQLTVADESNQEDTAKVTVVVEPESNHPPVADAGPPQSLFEPQDGDTGAVTLDGSKSTDDKKITSVNWKQLSGPQTTIVKPNAITTSVSGLNKAGDYVYQLTVFDTEETSNSDQVTITVKKEKPPVANAGPDIELTLPDNIAILDGRRSSDDYGQLVFHWKRDRDSPAAGRIFNNSDTQSVLVVTGLVEGIYLFHLKVTNIRGKVSLIDTARVTVMGNPQVNNLVELFLDNRASSFTESLKNSLMTQVRVLLSLDEDAKVVVQSVQVDHSSGGDLVVLLYVKLLDGTFMDSLEMVETLNQKLQSDLKLLNFNVKRADTYVCENECSGHGRCHSGSKECECDVFWMENFFRVYAGDGSRNCDWSILYVVIVSFVLAIILSSGVYFVTCCCLRRRKPPKPTRSRKKKHVLENGGYQKIPSKNSNGVAHKNGLSRSSQFRMTSLMRSMTSSSSSGDEEHRDHTLFEKRHLLDQKKRRAKRGKAPKLVGIGSDHSGDSFDGLGLDGGGRVALKGVTGKSRGNDDIL